MYGLLQSMRDRTPVESDKCLQDSVQQLPSCCSGHRGGVVLGYDCYLRIKGVYVTLAVAFSVGTVLTAVVIAGVFLYRRKVNLMKTPPAFFLKGNSSSNDDDIGYVEPEQLNLVVLRAATNNFSEGNKLGEGGFGEVFKGTLQDGTEIAVKRLSQNSSQGFQELKNELVLAAQLKHRNLVQLLGVSLQEEKLVIYKYMPNRSLDIFLSDPVRRQQLDWNKRLAIICGMARGLLYLHEESRLKVIHRDLKPSNVLLDVDMNPKISDFGIARAFVGDQSRDITKRPVGTLWYMSPEYAYWGHVSTKSDIFSFGVIVLEMVTRQRNNSAYSDTFRLCVCTEPCMCMVLLGHCHYFFFSNMQESCVSLEKVWDNWRAGSMVDVVDPLLAVSRYRE
ncbi:cysteine-rich receptor-like protein kinase 24 [Panicum virgatum]|uniref:cysteine-rich receptor-like protein kinase 24 n=1 Tax=Panicum virgatum TaxID=38727 RepID=UPI0019D59E2B|nr:cysteine-rich receptor-like protein kinase 24 [Panicum virgatum]